MCSQRAAWTRTTSWSSPPPVSGSLSPPTSTVTAAVPGPVESCPRDGCLTLWLRCWLEVSWWWWWWWLLLLPVLSAFPLALGFRRSCLIHPVSKRKARGSIRLTTVFMAVVPTENTKSVQRNSTSKQLKQRMFDSNRRQKQKSVACKSRNGSVREVDLPQYHSKSQYHGLP